MLSEPQSKREQDWDLGRNWSPKNYVTPCSFLLSRFCAIAADHARAAEIALATAAAADVI